MLLNECVFSLTQKYKNFKTVKVIFLTDVSSCLQYGLGTSLLERLMTTVPTYQRKQVYDLEDEGSTDEDDSLDEDDLDLLIDGKSKFDPNVITKLLKNYRSHPAILKV